MGRERELERKVEEFIVKKKRNLNILMKTPPYIIFAALIALMFVAIQADVPVIPPLLPTQQPWKSGATTVTLSNDGTLTISGKGPMANYSYYGNNATPWHSAIWHRAAPPITNLVIEEGVTHIGNYTFHELYGLKSVTIPGSVTTIGNTAFKRCTELASLTIEEGVKSIGGGAFYGCTTLTSVTIPSSMDGKIRGFVFAGCTNLRSVTIKDGVKSIGQGMFAGSNLTSVTIPNSVTSIGEQAFAFCRNLASITIPNGVTSIGKKAFEHCTALAFIKIPGSVTAIESGAFERSGLTSVMIEDGVKSIGGYAFADCIGLTSITMPNSVAELGKDVFTNCKRLVSITSRNPEPPKVGSHVFDRMTKNGVATFVRKADFNAFDTLHWNNACLYVPVGSIDAYRTDDEWRHFDCIRDIESYKKNIPWLTLSILITIILFITIFIIIKPPYCRGGKHG